LFASTSICADQCYPSIYLIHEDSKEKEFELEISWIGSETDNLFKPVPKDLYDEANAKAKAALENWE
jgi:20S proteasome subunit alpha 7